MNLRFLENTNLAILLMVSLSSVSSILAFNANNIVNNSFNINEISTNGSSITKKISNRSNGYIFTQFGHNLSLNRAGNCDTKTLYKDLRGSLYADIAWRILFNKSYYINFGVGAKGGFLSREKDLPLMESGKINVDGFIGIKHKIGIEAYIQGDYTLKKKDILSWKGNANQGAIINIQYANKNNYWFKWLNISLEAGYSNLYTLVNEGQSVFGIIRFNTKGLISYLGKIGKQINDCCNLQITLYEKMNKKGYVPKFGFKLGKIEKDSSITEGYYELESINKNNAIENGLTIDKLRPELQKCNPKGSLIQEEVTNLIKEETRDLIDNAEPNKFNKSNKSNKYNIKKNNSLSKEIHNYLEQYIGGHDEAKKVLTREIRRHQERIMAYQYKEQTNVKENVIKTVVEKSNLMLVGPTGVGKTLMVKKAAEFLDVPFVEINAKNLKIDLIDSNLSENILRKLLEECDFDLDKAKYGIIFIDEFDKLIKDRYLRDEIQLELLKIMEGTTITVYKGGILPILLYDKVELDTTNIMFVFAGVFEDLRKDGAKLEEKDLIRIGIKSEFIARISNICQLDPLSEGVLMDILVNKEGSQLKQIQDEFKRMNGIELEFEEGALRLIAKKTLESDLGARNLKAILGRVTTDLETFDSDSHDGDTYFITEQIARDKLNLSSTE